MSAENIKLYLRSRYLKSLTHHIRCQHVIGGMSGVLAFAQHSAERDVNVTLVPEMMATDEATKCSLLIIKMFPDCLWITLRKNKTCRSLYRTDRSKYDVPGVEIFIR